MTIRFARIAAIILMVLGLVGVARHVAAMPPQDRLLLLRRGVNLTNWFRDPVSIDPAALRRYLSDAAIDDLYRAGFSFVRIAVQPEILDSAMTVLIEQAARLQRHGLATVIVLHPRDWHLESSPADREALFRAWSRLAPMLRGLDARRTFPEVLNEPVFPGDPQSWAALQDRVRGLIRSVMPYETIVLTGNDWGSIGGLERLTASTDPNVVYSFHFYDPVEISTLDAWRPGLDRGALARLPFPVVDSVTCRSAALPTDSVTSDVVRYYCAQAWTAATIADRLDHASDWARRNHAAVLAGEFGATARLNQTARLAWLEAVRRACEERRFGWALWGYDDVMGFDVARPPGPRPRLNTGVLSALGVESGNSQSGIPGVRDGVGQSSALRKTVVNKEKPPADNRGQVTGRLHVWETQGSTDPLPATRAGTLAAAPP